MSLPAFVTVNGRQYRGTTAFARGWVDANGGALTIPESDPFPEGPIPSLIDLLTAQLGTSTSQRDITADGDTTALEAAFAALAREPLAYIAPNANATTYADLAAAVTSYNLLNGKVTALLAALVAKGYMLPS